MQQVMEEAAIDALVDSMELQGSGELVSMDDQTAQEIGQKSMYITSNAGKVPVWNVETGVRSDVLTTQLRAVLRAVFPREYENTALAGKRVYTLAEPAVKPRQGTIKCRLHPEHPDRAYLDGLGLKGIYCRKANIVDEFQAERHMELKHRIAAALIKRHEERLRQDAQFEIQKQMADSLAALNGRQSPVSAPKEEKPDKFFCDVCGRGFKNAFGLKGHQKTHQKER